MTHQAYPETSKKATIHLFRAPCGGVGWLTYFGGTKAGIVPCSDGMPMDSVRRKMLDTGYAAVLAGADEIWWGTAVLSACSAVL